MRIRRPFAVVLAVVSLLVGAATGAAAGPTPTGAAATTGRPQPRVVTSFPLEEFPPWGAFAESVAVDRAGNLFVTTTQFVEEGWNRGQVWKVTPAGVRTRFGPGIDVGILGGLAFDDHGRLYVAYTVWPDPVLPPLESGVLRVSATSATRVLTLPPGSWPNGLAFHGRDLYVSDSTLGVVWRTRPVAGVVDRPADPWLADPLLAPTSGWEGVNGIAFDGDVLYAVVADAGLLLRTHLLASGRAAPVRVLAADTALVNGDGLSLDSGGTVWVCVNGAGTPGEGSLVTVTRTGRVRVRASNPTWLDYPSQAAFGTTRSTRTTLYVANGALGSERSVADVVAVRVPAAGLRLPQRVA